MKLSVDSGGVAVGAARPSKVPWNPSPSRNCRSKAPNTGPPAAPEVQAVCPYVNAPSDELPTVLLGEITPLKSGAQLASDVTTPRPLRWPVKSRTSAWAGRAQARAADAARAGRTRI